MPNDKPAHLQARVSRDDACVSQVLLAANAPSSCQRPCDTARNGFRRLRLPTGGLASETARAPGIDEARTDLMESQYILHEPQPAMCFCAVFRQSLHSCASLARLVVLGDSRYLLLAEPQDC